MLPWPHSRAKRPQGCSVWWPRGPQLCALFSARLLARVLCTFRRTILPAGAGLSTAAHFTASSFYPARHPDCLWTATSAQGQRLSYQLLGVGPFSTGA